MQAEVSITDKLFFVLYCEVIFLTVMSSCNILMHNVCVRFRDATIRIVKTAQAQSLQRL